MHLPFTLLAGCGGWVGSLFDGHGAIILTINHNYNFKGVEWRMTACDGLGKYHTVVRDVMKLDDGGWGVSLLPVGWL